MKYLSFPSGWVSKEPSELREAKRENRAKKNIVGVTSGKDTHENCLCLSGGRRGVIQRISLSFCHQSGILTSSVC